MATLPVKYYHAGMAGAPQLTNAWGVLTDLLDACLVDGFALKAVDTLTQAAGVATATISAGHGYEKGQVIAIAGATQEAYNGEHRVLSASATTFTFAVPAATASPATGTLSAKVAPLGWETAFSGTQKRAYRSQNVESNRPYLRVDNSCGAGYTTTYAKKGKVTMAEEMTGIDTFTADAGRAPFEPTDPTRNERTSGSGTTVVDGWFKWYYAAASNSGKETDAPGEAARAWVLVGDDRGFYLFTDWSPGVLNNHRAGYCFTDFASFRAGDGYNTVLAATNSYAAANTVIAGNIPNGSTEATGPGITNTTNGAGAILMRNHTQLGGSVRAYTRSFSAGVSGRTLGLPWPNPADYALVLHPAYLCDADTGALRGQLPGMHYIINNGFPSDLTVVDDVTGYEGRQFLIVGCGGNISGYGNVAAVAFDITGPWWG